MELYEATETLLDISNTDPAIPLFNYDYLPSSGGPEKPLASAASETRDIFTVVAYVKDSIFTSKYVLRVYDSTGLLWDYDSFAPTPFGSSYAADIAISGNGNKIVVSTSTGAGPFIEITIFDLTSSTPYIPSDKKYPNMIVGNGKTTISKDLSTVLLASAPFSYNIYDISSDSLAVISSPPQSEFANYFPGTISSDSDMIAIQTLNGSYSFFWSRP